MTPTTYLNQSCIAGLMAKYTLIGTSILEHADCTIPLPAPEKWWTKTRIGLFVVVGLFIALILINSSAGIAKESVIANLHTLPSYSIHQEIEDRLEQQLTSSEKKKFIRDEKGRYTSVTRTETADVRTVTIVEDLRKRPLSSIQRSKRPKVERTAGVRIAQKERRLNAYWPVSAVPSPQQNDVPLENIEAATPSVSDADNRQEEDIRTPPPSYQHSWTNYV